MHHAWKRHQDAVWVDNNLAFEKGWTFFQTRSNAIILQERFPAYRFPKVVRLKTGEVWNEKVYMSPRPPPKISLKHEWKRELGSEVARQPDGEVACQAKIVQPTQPIPNPIRERSGRPYNMQDGRNASRSQEINVNSFCEELSSSERTERLVATFDTVEAKDSSRARSSHESDSFNVEDDQFRKRMKKSIADHDESHELMMFNEADMDFWIPGLPHSVVKHAQSTSVRQLIQRIVNHPDRHALRQDLRKNQSLNLLSRIKQMIQDVGNIELCELLETEPKTQCTVCLSYWIICILYCTWGYFLHRKIGQSASHQLFDGPSFSSWVRYQERKTSWTSIW